MRSAERGGAWFQVWLERLEAGFDLGDVLLAQFQLEKMGLAGMVLPGP